MVERHAQPSLGLDIRALKQEILEKIQWRPNVIPFLTALKAAGKPYEAYIYPGTHHGFHNDSTPRYDEPAAELAWQRTIAWFQRHLS